MAAPRNFLITGAARGIGRGLARQLLQKGHRVLLVDNNSLELRNTTVMLQKLGYNAGAEYDTIECNLRIPGDVTSAAQRAGKLFDGHLDCLINNAASESPPIKPRPVAEI